MAPEGAEMTCPACGERVYPTDQQCLACGARLDGGKLVGEATSTSAEEEPASRSGTMPGTAFPGGDDERTAEDRDLRREVSYAAAGRGGWDASRLSAERGFFASLSRGWSFLKESVAMAFRDRDLMIPSLLSVFANIVILAILAGVLYLTGDFDAIFDDESEQITVAGWIVLFVFSLIGYIVTYFFTGMTVHLVDVHLRGEDAKLGSAFADSVRNFGGIAALAVASLVVSPITGAVRGKSRGLRRAAADTMERGWIVITYLLLPIMILEDSPFMNSADRARKLHGHNVIQIVVGELGLLVATKLVSGLVVVLAIAGAIGAYFVAPAFLPVGIGVAALLLIVAMAFFAYVRTAFYTCLYLWAVAMETVGEEAPAPAPLRPAISAGW